MQSRVIKRFWLTLPFGNLSTLNREFDLTRATLPSINLGEAVAYWLGRLIQDRNEDFVGEFDSRWWILLRKFEILSKSCPITAVILYRCYPVTRSRHQPKYALGAPGSLAMGTNYTCLKSSSRWKKERLIFHLGKSFFSTFEVSHYGSDGRRLSSLRTMQSIKIYPKLLYRIMHIGL